MKRDNTTIEISYKGHSTGPLPANFIEILHRKLKSGECMRLLRDRKRSLCKRGRESCPNDTSCPDYKGTKDKNFWAKVEQNSVLGTVSKVLEEERKP